MAARYFTPEQANDALVRVRPLVETMIEHRRTLVAAQAERAELMERIAGNGGDIAPSDLAAVGARVEREARAVARCVQQIHAIGAQVKDLDDGLVDFPALRDGEEVLLCWRLGEDEIAYWHTLEDGFGGRRPLPL